MNRKFIILFTLAGILFLFSSFKYWGFFAHRRIDHMAVFTLPPEMIGFYKTHIDYITAHAIDPDKRRYAVKGEGPKHFIDIDHYGKHAFRDMPRNWYAAIELYSKDTLMEYGINPWWINFEYYRLRKAFKEKNVPAIIDISAEIGHYIADGNVPLHNTENYDGKMTGQKGIHAFWESRIPELFAGDYDYFVGRAHYIKNTLRFAWGITKTSAGQADSVLALEKKLSKKFSADEKYEISNRSGRTIRQYSRAYSKAYSKILNNMIERKMRKSIIDVGSMWYTCWIDGGKPDLNKLIGIEVPPNTNYDSTLNVNDNIKPRGNMHDEK